MPRRREKLDLTLFPFLSVLSGLIAVMVLLMIVTASTRVIDESPAGGSGAGDPGRSVADGIDPAVYARLDAEIAELTAALAEQSRVRTEVGLQLEALKGLIEAKKAELEKLRAGGNAVGVRLGRPIPKQMVPTLGSGKTTKRPIYVEVKSSGYVVHPERTTFPAVEIRKGRDRNDYVPSAELRTYLEGVHRTGDRYLVFLVHPNGADAFQLVDYIQERLKGLDVGWEPFAQEWILDNR